MDTSQDMLGWAAFRCAISGVRVLPINGVLSDNGRRRCQCGNRDCGSPGKHPLIKDWLTAASSDPEQVSSWWAKWPNANIGLICGEMFDVLDIDNGEEGTQVLCDAAIGRGLQPTPIIPTVATGRGSHTYFTPVGFNRSQLCSPKIQLLSEGRYVIAPPSLHISGNRYSYVAGSRPWEIDPTIPNMPNWLLQLVLDDERPHRGTGRDEILRGRHARGRARHPGSRTHAAVALRRACLKIARAPRGTRNSTLYKKTFFIAGYIQSGHLSVRGIIGPLRAAGLASGLGEREVDATLLSAIGARLGGTSKAGG